MYLMKPYDDSLKTILTEGVDQQERTGKGCRSYFGIQTKYDISEYIPILTYRKVFWKSFVKEVLWYISGSDKISDLQKSGCNVWTPWIDNEFTENNNFEPTSIGYGYGMNLIHYGGNLSKLQPIKGGFNQLDYVINTLRNDPISRQAMFVMWRPDKLDQVLLPACHFAYHFFTSLDENGEMKDLNCQIFQRSNDFAVGVHANILIATIFTYMIAQQLDMKPKLLIHSGSHCHIYHNAISQVEEYLERVDTLPVKYSPKLKLNKKESIYDYTIEDFVIDDYDSYSKIQMEIAV